MIANITIETTTGQITANADVDFTFKELPYGCKGYGFNGSSRAIPDTLQQYWTFVDTFLKNNNLTQNEYVSLINISSNGQFYGILKP